MVHTTLTPLMGGTGQQVIGNYGSNLTIPMSDPNITHQNRITTPEWMINVDGLTSSTITQYEEYAPLLGWYAEQARITQGSTANTLYSTSAVQHSNVIIVIPNDIYAPVIEDKMNNGSNLANIKIVRLANIADLKVGLQEVVYTNCKIESLRQELDVIIISFRPETRENTIVQYNQDGTKEGQNVAKFNYTTGEAE